MKQQKCIDNDYLEDHQIIADKERRSLKSQYANFIILTGHLNDEEKNYWNKVCYKFSSILHKNSLTFTNLVKHKIRTTTGITTFT